MSRLSCHDRIRRAATALTVAFYLAGETALPSATTDVPVNGPRVEEAVTGIPRPDQLAFNASGNLLVLSHGWSGDAAAEIYHLDLTGSLPVDAAHAPRLVIPFSEGPRKAIFGSMAVDPRSADLFLGEENGNRVYRLTAVKKLTLFATGLYYLVGGGSLAFDERGRLLILDFASPEGLLRSEAPPPSEFDWLAAEAYEGPLVFRLGPEEDIPGPRRLDIIPPLFPRGWPRREAGQSLPRFISVAASPLGELLLLSSLGEVFKLTSEGGLQLLVRLPAGHYQRTDMAVAPDGGVFVSTGFHIRRIFRISPAGRVTTIARELGDPEGIAVDRSGNLYVAETALHRVIRIRPSP